MKEIKIVLVDDEQLFRDGLETMLNQMDGIKTINSFDNGEPFLDYLKTEPINQHPDIALLDLKMAPLNGIDTAKELNAHYPHIRIIILSTYHSTTFVGYIFKIGVNAFLSKSIERTELSKALNQVYRNNMYLTPEDNRSILEYLKNPNTSGGIFSAYETLSTREIEILKLICAQKTNKEIADTLFISKRTVDGHRMHLIEKTGARNTAGLVLFAIHNQTISLEEFSLYQELNF